MDIKVFHTVLSVAIHQETKIKNSGPLKESHFYLKPGKT